MIHVAPWGLDGWDGTVSSPLLTLTGALTKADPHIVMAAGEYPAQTGRRNAQMTTVEAHGATMTGLSLKGCKNITMRGGRVEGTVDIESSSGATSPPEDIRLIGVEVKGTVKILNLAKRIDVIDCHIHHSGAGVTFPGRGNDTLRSDGVSVIRCVIEDMTADGIQATDVDNLLVQGCTIRRVRDPAGVQHNDCIQLGGGNRGVRIVGNVLDDSGAQLLFIQDAIRPIDDVVVQGNTLLRCAAVAFQCQGATNTRIVGNVIDGGDEGGLWLREGFHGLVPTDTVVTGNFIRSVQTPSFRKWNGATTGFEQDNITF